MRRAIWFVCLLLLTNAATAWADPLPGENIRYRSGEETVTGYLARPGGPGPHPPLVVIHEWWRLNDWVKQQADQFAQEDYVALAVDPYRGKAATSRDEAHELSRGLPHDRAIRDLLADIKKRCLPDRSGEGATCVPKPQ